MKKLRILALLLLFFLLCINVFGTTKSYPFEVQKSGQGKQALIFIPGFASSGEVWKETTAHFEKSFTCYTLTMAGFAGVKPQPGASFSNWENAIASYIKDHHIEKPIIIGHSMGGGLAMAIASDYPELIRKIIIIDALPCLSALMNPAFASRQNNNCTPVVEKMTSMTDAEFLQMQSGSVSRLVADTNMKDTIINWSMTSDRTTFAGMYCDFSNIDLRGKIKSIQCPSLILLESYFTNFKPAIEDQYKKLKNVNLQYATKGLHFIMFDDKEWYFSQLDKFFSAS